MVSKDLVVRQVHLAVGHCDGYFLRLHAFGQWDCDNSALAGDA